jgi:predicted GNAT family N-acyltransferase
MINKVQTTMYNNTNLSCGLIDFGSPEFDESLSIRHEVLRAPLGMEFHPEDIELEVEDYHIACWLKDEMVGSLIVKKIDPSTAKIRQVAIAAKYHGNGYGMFLAQWSEVFCKQKGLHNLVLHARAKVSDFYLKQGYQIEGELFEEVGIPHYFMKKSLL